MECDACALAQGCKTLIKLSSIYKGKKMYAVVYTTGHLCWDGESEAEFVDERFFSTQTEARDFLLTFDRKSFTDLFVVEVTGLHDLKVS